MNHRQATTPLSRRSFAQSLSLATGLAWLGTSRPALAAPQAKVHDLRVISKSAAPYYCGWPTVTRRRNGQLLVVWSGGRQSHVCPFGRVEMMRSDDQGETWTWPRVLLDSPIDDRDAGILETAKGSLLVSTFTSLAYAPELERALGDNPHGWIDTKIDTWAAAHHRLSDQQRRGELGEWMIRSTDGGVTWSARYATIVNSPHGPIQLADGRLLYAGKELWTDQKRIGICQSIDDGQSWQWLAEIPTRGDDDRKAYHELHAVEADSGRLIVHIRNHNQQDAREILQSESDDGGKTWSVPHAIGVWGLPSFLTKLRDGRLVMSYGHRRHPYGNQARVSNDHGATWGEPLTISADGVGSDLGYPSTVELDDGRLLTIWYERLAGSPLAVLRQAKWSLE